MMAFSVLAESQQKDERVRNSHNRRIVALREDIVSISKTKHSVASVADHHSKANECKLFPPTALHAFCQN